MYLTTSRPDLQLSVGICARFQSNPKQSHLNDVKRILRYLIGTTNLGLWYEQVLLAMLQTTVMLILLETELKEKAQVVVVAFLESH